MVSEPFPEPFPLGGTFLLPRSGIMIFVPGSSGSPPWIRMVTPPESSCVTCASRGCMYTDTALAASMRADIGNFLSCITARRNSWGSSLSSLYLGSGPRTSCSDFLDNAAALPENAGSWVARRGRGHFVRRKARLPYTTYRRDALGVVCAASCRRQR